LGALCENTMVETKQVSSDILPDVTEDSPFPVLLAQKILRVQEIDDKNDIDLTITEFLDYRLDITDELSTMKISFDGKHLKINGITYRHDGESRDSWEFVNIDEDKDLDKQNLSDDMVLDVYDRYYSRILNS